MCVSVGMGWSGGANRSAFCELIKKLGRFYGRSKTSKFFYSNTQHSLNVSASGPGSPICLFVKTETTLSSTSNAENVTFWQLSDRFCLAVCQLLPQSHTNHMEMLKTTQMWMLGGNCFGDNWKIF